MQISQIMYLADQLHKFYTICDTVLSRMIHKTSSAWHTII